MSFFGIDRPQDYTDANSFAFKRWCDKVYKYFLATAGVVTVMATYSVAANLYYFRCDGTAGAFTITVPLAKDNPGRRLLIKKIDSSVNAITVGRTGTDTFEGSTTKTLSSQWSHIQVISNGVNGWEII